jgi:FixJ family two-component response regulator
MQTELKEKNFIFAVVDDDKEWREIINEKLYKEYKGIQIKIDLFDDFKKFYKFEDLNKYDIIITDYYFDCYNLDSIEIESILKKFNGRKILVTGNPSSVQKKIIFNKILNKTHIMKPTFKFSRYIDS